MSTVEFENYKLLSNEIGMLRDERDTLRSQLLAAQGAMEAMIAENARLRDACMKLSDEVEQSLGKALGYPWYKDDLKNFPNATEANGVCVGEHSAESIADEAANRIRNLTTQMEAMRASMGEEWTWFDDRVSTNADDWQFCRECQQWKRDGHIAACTRGRFFALTPATGSAWAEAMQSAEKALDEVQSQVERMMVAAKPIGEGEWVESYHIQTGALHTLAGYVRGGIVSSALAALRRARGGGE